MEQKLSRKKKDFVIGLLNGMGSLSVVVDGFAEIPTGKHNGFTTDMYLIGLDFVKAVDYAHLSLPTVAAQKVPSWQISGLREIDKRKRYS